jgi:hypothetical protein
LPDGSGIISNLPSMRKWIFTNKIILTGAMGGAVAGYLYYRLIGCSSGTCLISSKPVNSTVYFSVMGAILFSLFKKQTRGERNSKR